MIQGTSEIRDTITKLMMVSLVILTMAGATLAAANSIPADRNGLPQWEIKEWTDFPVQLKLENHEQLNELLARVPLASFHREQLVVHYDSPKAFHLIFTPIE